MRRTFLRVFFCEDFSKPKACCKIIFYKKKIITEKYHLIQRQTHPDFHTQATEDEKEAALNRSSQANEAYAIFSNSQRTLEYYLWEMGEIKEGDLLIVPSGYEGDGLVVVEGLQQKVPMLLSDIPDFRRFGFPDSNYCVDPADFVNRISEYKNRINELKVPASLRGEILNSRTPKVVGDSWVSYLNQESN